MKIKKLMKRIGLVMLLMIYSWVSLAQDKSIGKIKLIHGAHRSGKRTDEVMQKWRSYGLGQFIHWGLYAIPGGEWEGKKFTATASEWIRTWSAEQGAPENWKTTYDNLYKQFNPVNFNPEGWAKTAKQMGARYVTITTKHHDGFCLWPSKYTDYTVARSPWKKDVIKPLVDAYDKEGIDVILYFSVMDWHHPGWRYELKTKADSLAFESFKSFTRNQLIELLTLYPKAKGLWFDGTWDKSWVAQAAFADSLETELRTLRPGLIIGSRFRADEYGKRHFDSNGELMGDYEQGWERKLPEKISDVKGNDWDCVMTVPENQWGYNKNWTGHVKSWLEIVEMTAKSVSLGGNFVLNFGPQRDGAIRKEELELARQIGAWMREHSDAIYDCQYAGLDKQDWGYFTKKTATGKINMIVFNPPISGEYRVKVPAKMGIKHAFLQGSSTPLAIEEIKSAEYFIKLNQKASDSPFVITFELQPLAGKANDEQKAKT